MFFVVVETTRLGAWGTPNGRATTACCQKKKKKRKIQSHPICSRALSFRVSTTHLLRSGVALALKHDLVAGLFRFELELGEVGSVLDFEWGMMRKKENLHERARKDSQCLSLFAPLPLSSHLFEPLVHPSASRKQRGHAQASAWKRMRHGRSAIGAKERKGFERKKKKR